MTGSLELKPGEKVFIETRGFSTLPMLSAMIRAATEVGAVPFYYFNDDSLAKEFINAASEEQMKMKGAFDKAIMEQCSAYVVLRAEDDLYELQDVSEDKMVMFQNHHFSQVHRDTRIPKLRWCVLRYPNSVKAAMNNMSIKQYEDFYFSSCLLDYKKMGEAMVSLKKMMEKTDRVRIIGPDTDIEFSIKGIMTVVSAGRKNLPDGEVYTAPIIDSINGHVFFNTRTDFNGYSFSNIYLEFENGKIVNSRCTGNQKSLDKILDMDAGSRYMGEFALGVNPYILSETGEGLFDEKISGSFHIAIGNSFEGTCDNGNRSNVHWDLIQIQTEQCGGGEIYFDGVLIRKDGVFVVDELLCLNPENLV